MSARHGHVRSENDMSIPKSFISGRPDVPARDEAGVKEGNIGLKAGTADDRERN
ncbi:hypothetical protein YTPLAS18_18650 [Nitrospira sp.]|nr:hypothetical protein YTPLAS18_18650 [Nitrospira sp.]